MVLLAPAATDSIRRFLLRRRVELAAPASLSFRATSSESPLQESTRTLHFPCSGLVLILLAVQLQIPDQEVQRFGQFLFLVGERLGSALSPG